MLIVIITPIMPCRPVKCPHFINTHENTIGSGFYHPQCTDEGTEAQRGQMTLLSDVTS